MKTKVNGTILALCLSAEKHVKKNPVPSARLIREHGLDGDAHAGPGLRQVSLLARESVVKMEREDLPLPPGIFGENILTQGIDLLSLDVGQRLKLGKSVLAEVTQHGKECNTPCAIFRSVGFCVMPTEGIFIRVLSDGEIKPGDTIQILDNRDNDDRDPDGQ